MQWANFALAALCAIPGVLAVLPHLAPMVPLPADAGFNSPGVKKVNLNLDAANPRLFYVTVESLNGFLRAVGEARDPAMKEEFAIIDLRSAKEFNLGPPNQPIPGAINWPIDSDSKDLIAERKKEIESGNIKSEKVKNALLNKELKLVIFHCQFCRSRGPQTAIEFARYYPNVRVAIVHTGWEGYKKYREEHPELNLPEDYLRKSLTESSGLSAMDSPSLKPSLDTGHSNSQDKTFGSTTTTTTTSSFDEEKGSKKKDEVDSESNSDSSSKMLSKRRVRRGFRPHLNGPSTANSKVTKRGGEWEEEEQGEDFGSEDSITGDSNDGDQLEENPEPSDDNGEQLVEEEQDKTWNDSNRGEDLDNSNSSETQFDSEDNGWQSNPQPAPQTNNPQPSMQQQQQAPPTLPTVNQQIGANLVQTGGVLGGQIVNDQIKKNVHDPTANALLNTAGQLTTTLGTMWAMNKIMNPNPQINPAPGNPTNGQVTPQNGAPPTNNNNNNNNNNRGGLSSSNRQTNPAPGTPGTSSVNSVPGAPQAPQANTPNGAAARPETGGSTGHATDGSRGTTPGTGSSSGGRSRSTTPGAGGSSGSSRGGTTPGAGGSRRGDSRGTTPGAGGSNGSRPGTGAGGGSGGGSRGAPGNGGSKNTAADKKNKTSKETKPPKKKKGGKKKRMVAVRFRA